ncbi:RES family NAD+ phosphorylase [Marinobacter halotolerans]|uniref:RES family NAD+ phosphorylase n=1 Tax=Marinobacter halotolerans TaxID=1569211 RepID=UPI001245F13C|nr:RES family NAD+ phosphorylase [Marinobacter halotolerans]
MKAYRITKRKHKDTAFSGFGARQYGGRWNLPNYPAVYLSESIALAQLETLVNLGDEDSLKNYVLLQLEVPDNLVMVLADDAYPKDWKGTRVSAGTQEIGTNFLMDGAALALAVRSCVVPQEYNLVFNPEHPDAEAVIEEGVEVTFQFDDRLVSD